MLLLFLRRDVSKTLKNEKLFFCLEIAEIDGKGVNFGSKRTTMDIKTRLSKVNPIFRGYMSKFYDLFHS